MSLLDRVRFALVLALLAVPPSVPAQEKSPEKARDKPKVEKPKAAPRVPEGVKALRDIEYVPGGGPRRTLDLYLPEKAAGPLPLIIWVHGGGWSAGSKENCPALLYTRRGYAVASINYRLSQSAVFPAQIQDCKAAVRWLRANAKTHGLDPERFGAWGSSAGGHLVALLGTAGDAKDLDGDGPNREVSSRVQAVCDWFGPTDLLKMDAQSGPNSRIKHDAPASPESRLIGGAIQENKEKAERANPIKYVGAGAPPFLIMHGDQDPLVPLGQSELLHEALKKAGVDSTLHVVKGAGHGFGRDAAGKLVEEFFDRHLKRGK
jgi:acetyl esterase/lipase